MLVNVEISGMPAACGDQVDPSANEHSSSITSISEAPRTFMDSSACGR